VNAAKLMVGRRICICAGSGGVGKTTTAAALAVGLAARGARVAVVTIDPARRLAQALGLEQLDNEPRRVDPGRFAGHHSDWRGELWAMMLDAKRTFDDLIELLAPNASTRDAIFANRIYQELSSAVAGSQEFTAVAKLYELDRSGRFDCIVLDTPPSRNAMDFLDAPGRLTGFLEGRALKLVTAPTGAAATLASRSSALVLLPLRRITGVDLLADLAAFFGVLGEVVDGFAERANAVSSLLSDPATTFLIITGPDAATVREAIFLRRRLLEAKMPLGGLLVNRVRVLAPSAPPIDELALAESFGGDRRLAARSIEALEDLRALARRDAENLKRLTGEFHSMPPMIVPQLDREASDIDGLAAVGRFLFAGARERDQLLAEQAF
jgi:anion-transporting  ArsA/GET3 family ATPase